MICHLHFEELDKLNSKDILNELIKGLPKRYQTISYCGKRTLLWKRTLLFPNPMELGFSLPCLDLTEMLFERFHQVVKLSLYFNQDTTRFDRVLKNEIS